MIGSLRGQVLERWGDATVLIDVGGVGYEVTVTPRTLAELEPTSAAFLYIHHHIREADQSLFGFLGRDEVTTFKTLLATHGVGPALALSIVAAYPPAELVDIVAANDVSALKAVSGVGPKTAQRLLVELRDRLSLPMLTDTDTAGGGSSQAAVREALAGLGYQPDEIRDTMRDLGDVVATGDAATVLREALKLLGARHA